MASAMKPTKMFFDGGCRPNPGVMHAAVVVKGEALHHSDLGFGSSEEAEWLALLFALEVAEVRGLRDIILLGDSASVLAQASGTAKSRRFPDHLERFRSRAASFAGVRLRHVGRAQNLAGIALAAQRQRTG